MSIPGPAKTGKNLREFLNNVNEQQSTLEALGYPQTKKKKPKKKK